MLALVSGTVRERVGAQGWAVLDAVFAYWWTVIDDRYRRVRKRWTAPTLAYLGTYSAYGSSHFFKACMMPAPSIICFFHDRF
ncbi:hypothetical protein R69746_06895 [Paraburkholderia aspalathi]|nr:hypothetical protein R69746_06895 [Paraburkholderia aspalathi]